MSAPKILQCVTGTNCKLSGNENTETVSDQKAQKSSDSAFERALTHSHKGGDCGTLLWYSKDIY